MKLGHLTKDITYGTKICRTSWNEEKDGFPKPVEEHTYLIAVLDYVQKNQIRYLMVKNGNMYSNWTRTAEEAIHANDWAIYTPPPPPPPSPEN